MPGLPARLAVLAPVPFRFLPLASPRLAPLACPDALLRRRRPRVGTVLIQPPFQLRHPQFQPPPQLPLRVQPRPQHPDLGVLRLDHGLQPGQQLTLLPAPAGRSGTSGTSHDRAQPELQVQALATTCRPSLTPATTLRMDTKILPSAGVEFSVAVRGHGERRRWRRRERSRSCPPLPPLPAPPSPGTG
jgi:hypothetical protein